MQKQEVIKVKRILLISLGLSCFNANLHSQIKPVKPQVLLEPKGWHLKDKEKDNFLGISLDKAYKSLKQKKPVKIIVGVIDSGVDTLHEDLKDILWVNKKELPGNGIDEDGNGYVDDIHGWNFLGNKNGDQAEDASSEKARVYHGLKAKYLNKDVDTTKFSALELYHYKEWLRAAKEIEPSQEKVEQYTLMSNVYSKLTEWDSLIVNDGKIKEYNAEVLEKTNLESDEAKLAKKAILNMFNMLPFGPEAKNTTILPLLKEEVTKLKKEIDEKDIEPEDVHKSIIKDNYADPKDKFYGNTNIMGKNSLHGTHVCGIIGANRNNKVGIMGIADNVEVMMVRAVPNGDEYDKDVALAIRYAVDNGAKVINMSFGKSYSPEKYIVDDAIKYAAAKDVLIIHAAGNDAKDLDESFNYPSTDFLDNSTATNVITVGASSDTLMTGSFISSFSNYGKQHVDLFAPGSQIYSCLPGGKEYGFLDGTSMASPVVAGIAALLRSYFPSLTAAETKACIIKGVKTLSSNAAIFIPGKNKEATMNNLCITGGFANAFLAINEAAALSKKKK